MSSFHVDGLNKREYLASQSDISCPPSAHEVRGRALRWASTPVLKRIVAGTVATILISLFPVTTLFAMGKSVPVTAEPEKVAVTATPNGAQNRTTIKDLLSDPAKFNQSDVQVEGKFKGWNGTCTKSSILTRSDWILDDETGCIYVTGPVPEGLSPMQPHDERIKVSGRVISTNTGKPIFKSSLPPK